MGIHLYPYQRIWINWIAKSNEFLGIASRASAKSWLIAVYGIARCILYPGTTIALASSTKAQAGLIISDKCQKLHDESPNIQRETIKIVSNRNNWEMSFKNGSRMNVVVSGEAGRGHRSNVTVLEERRLIETEVIDSIIRPFLVARQPSYLKNPKYEHFKKIEEPQEIIISSAHYKAQPWYIEAKILLNKIANGSTDVKGIFLDYHISLKHGIKTLKQMLRDKAKLDPITFIMEYGNIPYGSSALSFFKLKFFNRDIKRAWRPIRTEKYLLGVKNKYNIPKLRDETRIMGIDIATRAGASNDNTIIVCARLFPTKKGYLTDVVYLESHNGKNTNLQAQRIKQIFEEFQGDILVMDIASAGIGVYDSLCKITKDEDRGVEYPSYTVMVSEHITDKTYEDLWNRAIETEGARECIFPISADNKLNSQMAIKFRERLKNKMIRFLVDDAQEEEYLIKANNEDILEQGDNGESRAYLLNPHIQTSLLINECISLELALTGAAGLIKLVEPPGGRKDRYSATSYMNYYISLLDTEFLKNANTNLSDEEAFLGVSVVV
jgi:hypothetical protein